MHPYISLLIKLVWFGNFLFTAKGQNNIFTKSDGTRLLPKHQRTTNEFLNLQDIIPFSQSVPAFQHLDAYVPQKNLQLSHLPIHVQQTYQFTTTQAPQYENQHTVQTSIPSPFKQLTNQFSQNAVYPTQRPDYSGLFAHTYSSHPLGTDSFFRQLTFQTPTEAGPQVHDFKSLKFSSQQPIPHLKENTQNSFLREHKNSQASANHDKNFTKKPRASENAVNIESKTRPNFLNYRTRYIAPDSNEMSRTSMKDYFVNKNGDVLITTEPSPSPSVTQTTEPVTKSEISYNNLSSSTKPTEVELASHKRKFNFTDSSVSTTTGIDFLLEEHAGKTEIATDKFNIKNEDELDSDSISYDDYVYNYATSETLDDYENTQDTSSDQHEKNNIHGDDILGHNPVRLKEQDVEEKIDHKSVNAESKHNLEIATDTPGTETPDYEYDDDKDINFTKGKLVRIRGSKDDSEKVLSVENVNLNGSSKVDGTQTTNEAEPKLVVSIVTTKSVVNNTIIPTFTSQPHTFTEYVTLSPFEGDSPTDSWIVVASVQTSRSVSGSKYASSPVPNQEGEQLEQNVPNVNNFSKNISDFASEESDVTQKVRTSTESLTDKLDRVQSDLLSGLLSGGFKNSGNKIALITETVNDKSDVTTMLDLDFSSVSTTNSIPSPSSAVTKSPVNSVVIRKFSPKARPPLRREDLRSKYANDRKPTTSSQRAVTHTPPINVLPTRIPTVTSKKNVHVQDVSPFLPPEYKRDNKETQTENSSNLLQEILEKFYEQGKKNDTNIFEQSNVYNKSSNTRQEDVPEYLPGGYKLANASTEYESLHENTTRIAFKNETVSPKNRSEGNVNATMPRNVDKIPENAKKVDVSAFSQSGLKPAFRPNTSTPKSINVEILLKDAKTVDISAFLPPGFKPTSNPNSSTIKPKNVETLLKDAKTVDVSAFLPPGFKPTFKPNASTSKSKNVETLLKDAKTLDVSAFLPPGFKPTSDPIEMSSQMDNANLFLSSPKPSIPGKSTATTTSKPKGFKVVFPSRPGSIRKNSRLTTPKSVVSEIVIKPSQPTIHKGWPTRATTEFTGWPTPLTTPISLEKLLEVARTASTNSISTTETMSIITTTSGVITTTSPRSTTPGKCIGECDVAGTIKLIAGAKWVPELLDKNTKEWQTLANEVQIQLEDVFGRSTVLNKWYKKVRIDGFTEGSVLVDYLVELNDLGKQVDTTEIKRLFHESLEDAESKSKSREGKSLNQTARLEGKLSLGKFVVDPKYTDFIVLPKHMNPDMIPMEGSVLLPQWAIAVIVIGLASLLFVVIFGVTVLVNRQKNAKKKAPTTLTENMLNELNKSHMGGLDNYGIDDMFNVEDAWNDRDETRIPKKRSSSSYQDSNIMPTLNDSWRSEWNGYYYNAYHGNPSSSQSAYGRQRSDYDTNF